MAAPLVSFVLLDEIKAPPVTVLRKVESIPEPLAG